MFAFDIPTENATTVFTPLWTGFGQDFGRFLELKYNFRWLELKKKIFFYARVC